MNWISSARVAGEVVDGHDDRQAEAVDVLDVLLQVFDALVERLDVRLAQFLQRHAAVQLQGADRGHDHHGVGLDAGLAALDVEELLRPEIGAEAGLGHGVVGEPHRELRGQHAVAAVGDVGERAAVDQRRVVLERLHQVRLDGVLQQRGHRAVGLQIGGGDRLLLARVADDDPAEALLQSPGAIRRGRRRP